MQTTDTVIVYRRADGDWGWAVKARNGRLIATSGEGFKRPGYATKVAMRVTGAAGVTVRTEG